MTPTKLLFSALLLLAFSGCKPTPPVAQPAAPEPSEPASSVAPASPTAAQPVPTQAPPRVLRVVTWNLAWFPGGKPNSSADESRTQMEGAQQVLVELNPDVLLLQEIRDWESAAELCRVVPGLQVHVTSRYATRPQNLVIASKLAANSAWSADWEKHPSNPPRGYSFAALEVPGRGHLLTYSLHLKSNQGDYVVNQPMREESARQLLTHIEQMQALYGRTSKAALIVGGDLNTSLDDPRFAGEQTLRAFLKAGLHWSHEGVLAEDRITLPGSGQYPDTCFDHLFTAGLKTRPAQVKQVAGVSDHHPVLLEVDLAGSDFQWKLDRTAAELALASGAPIPPAPPVLEVVPGMVAASDEAAIRAAVGKIVRVRGVVEKIGRTRNGSIHFLNFQGNGRGQFTGIVRAINQPTIESAVGGPFETSLAGKTIELIGEIKLFEATPQIEVLTPEQIKVIPSL